MKIVVLVKQVPDTWGDRRLDTSSGLLDRGSSDAIIDEIGERAIEVALQQRMRTSRPRSWW
jgi:electron transfer flavoprotein beta subunit